MKIFAVLVLMMLSAAGNAQTYQDWHVVANDGDTVTASTINASGGRLMKSCYVSTQNCMWGMSVGPSCNDGASYVVLVNAKSGVRSIETTCMGAKKANQYMVFNDFAAMEEISNNDEMIGFAVAMESGQFQVVRFSLLGSEAATAATEAIVMSAAKDSTRDLSL